MYIVIELTGGRTQTRPVSACKIKNKFGLNWVKQAKSLNTREKDLEITPYE